MNKLFNISNGALDVLSSGLVVIDSTLPTTIEIADNGPTLKLVLKFVQDNSNDATSYKIASLQGDTMTMVFTNYNHIFGTYATKAFVIGSAYDRELYFSFIIYALDGVNGKKSDLKKIEYTFFLGKEVKHG